MVASSGDRFRSPVLIEEHARPGSCEPLAMIRARVFILAMKQVSDQVITGALLRSYLLTICIPLMITACGDATATVTVQAVALFGLDFQGSASTTGTVRFRFTNPLAIYPATDIWQLNPRSQAEYYTTFFWGNDGEFWWDNGFPNTTYGAHQCLQTRRCGP